MEGTMRFRLVVNGEPHEVETSAGGVSLDGRPIRGSASSNRAGNTVQMGRKRFRVLLTRWGAVVDDVPYRIEIHDVDLGQVPRATTGAGPAPVGRIEVRPPMPGRVVRVAVAKGQRVPRHGSLVVLEAMKMQNEIPAPAAGTVREVCVREGQNVRASDVLVVLEPG